MADNAQGEDPGRNEERRNGSENPPGIQVSSHEVYIIQQMYVYRYLL